MDKYIPKTFRQFLALILCMAMLTTVIPAPAFAAELTGSTETVAAPAQTQEWALPDCDCGSTEDALSSHGETCAQRTFLEEFSRETAAAIFAKWEKLPEAARNYVLECLSRDDAEKLAELNGYLTPAEPAAETETVTGETEDITGETEDATGETEDVTGETEDITGETEDVTGETEDTTGETEDVTGETEDTTGETEDVTGETEDVTGETEDAPNATEDIPEVENGIMPLAEGPANGALAVVWSGSDFQLGTGSTTQEKADNNKVLLREIIDAMQDAGITYVDEALFPGDLTPESGYDASVIGSEAVLEVLGEEYGLTEDDIMFGAGNHDSGSFDLNDPTGGYEREHYAVYNINQADFPSGSTLSKVQATANALDTWLDEKAEEGYAKPIFVMTHVPLHHNWRQDNRNARYVVDVLNEAGAKGLNIIFLFGHNHSGDYDCYLGGSCIYYAPGDTMLVTEPGGTLSDFEEVQLNFTYMTAGYVGYVGTGETNKTLSACAFEIYEDRVEITRFNKNGVVDLKNAGKHGSEDGMDDSGNYLWEADTTVTSSPQKLNLSDIVLGVDEANTTLGDSLTRGQTANVAITVGNAANYTVSWESFDPDVATVEGNGTAAVITAVEYGTTTVQATVSGASRAAGIPATIQFDVTVAGSDPVAIDELIIFELVEDLYDSFDTSSRYMILSTDQVGAAKAFGGADSSGARNGDPRNYVKDVETIRFSPAGDGVYTTSSDGYDIWKFEKYTSEDISGYTLHLDRAAYYVGANKNLLDVASGTSATNMRITSSVTGSGCTALFDVADNSDNPLTTKGVLNYGDPIELTGNLLGYDSANGFFKLGASADPVYFYKEALTIENGSMWVEGSGSIAVDTEGELSGAKLCIMIDNVVHKLPITTDMVTGAIWSLPGTYTATVTYLDRTISTNFQVTVTSKDGSNVDVVDVMVNEGNMYQYVNKTGSQIQAGDMFIFADNRITNSNRKNPEIVCGAGNALAATEDGVTAGIVNVEKIDRVVASGYFIYNDDPNLVWVAESGNSTYLRNLGTGEYLTLGELLDNGYYGLVMSETKKHNWYFSSDNSSSFRASPAGAATAHTPNYDGNGSFHAIPYGDTTNYNNRIWTYEKVDFAKIVAYVDQNYGTVEAGATGKLTPGGNLVVITSQEDGSSTKTVIPITLDLLDVTVADLLTPGVKTCKVIYDGVVISSDYQLTVTGEEKAVNVIDDTHAAYLTDKNAEVLVGAGGSQLTGDEIILITMHEDGTVTEERIHMTVGMLSATSDQLNNVGKYPDLKVICQDLEITDDYILTVNPKYVNDKPDFPDEGAVKIDKWADTSVYDYFGTGTAQVNLSVTGIPNRNKANAVIIVDASSSMRSCIHGHSGDRSDDWTAAERASLEHFLLEDTTTPLTEEEKALFQRAYDAYAKNLSDNYKKAFNTRMGAGESYGNYEYYLRNWIEYLGYCSASKLWAGKEDGDCPTRERILEDAMVKMIQDFAAEDANGYVPDVDIAIAYFNSYTQLDNNYLVKDTGTHFGAAPSDGGEVIMNFTNSRNINDAVLQAIRDGYKTTSGTNYDDAMAQAYDLLKAKQIKDYQDYLASGSDEDFVPRQDFVIFMSDGMPYQFNYFGGNVGNWSKWVNGTMDEALTAGQTYADAGFVEEAYLDVFEEYYHPDGKLWMAEAIKGDETQKYKIIDPNANTDKHITHVNGLGATLMTIGFNLGTEGGSHEVMKRIATSDGYYTPCETAEDIENAFSAFSTLVRSANNAVFKDQMGEQFNLQMSTTMTTGDQQTVTLNPSPMIQLKWYEIWKHAQEGQTYTLDDGTTVTVTEDMVGTRKSDVPMILETVIFSADGKKAYSTHVDADKDGTFGAVLNADGTYSIADTDDNILKDDVICAANFWYNTNLSTTKTITANGVSVSLEHETFYWNVGEITEDELVLSYFVYLTGSMEGKRNEAGRYETNEYAELTYTNYLGHDCVQSVPTPVLPWQQATVGYGFYLVNKEGKPIINQTTGQTGSFEQAVRITTPVYETFALNSESEEIVATVVAAQKLPDGYTLFDELTSYRVQLNSNGKGYYEIVVTKAVDTTYVAGVESTAITGHSKVDTEAYTTANTVVWFAVYAEVAAVPDTVVIDYALPVEINVLKNDTLMGDYGQLKFIGQTAQYLAVSTDKPLWEYLQTIPVTQTPAFETVELNGKYGTAKVNATTGNVRYELNESNGMEMKDEETFVYAVNYAPKADTNKPIGIPGYYYSTVTVIPATSIYYEDSFVKYSVFDMNDELLNETWEDAGSESSADQAQDRPGQYSLPDVDANNIYGYDGAYQNMATYSMGSAKKVTVNSDKYAEAQFSFWGTGFDITSLTSNATGTITVSIYDADAFKADRKTAQSLQNFMVDTYYGCKYTLCNVTYEWDVTKDHPDGHWVLLVDGEAAAGTAESKAVLPEKPVDGTRVQGVEYAWIVDQTAADNALYQVPVMKVRDLEYKHYTALITVWYTKVLDHQNVGSYDFYLDSVRIYDPANDGTDNKVIQDAYVADGEGWPEYFELRNLLIASKDFDAMDDKDAMNGIIFIDNTEDDTYQQSYTIEDYTNYGPNNELYLAPGQSVAFDLNVADPKLAHIHLAMKTTGGTAYAKFYDADSHATNIPTTTIATATDLYYDITSLNGKTVVITNAGGSGDAILSVTNVKVTYAKAHTDSIENSYFQTTPATGARALMSLRAVPAPEVPEETIPEETIPEETIPEETVPETTVPDVEEPEVFEPSRFTVRLSDSSVKVGSKVTVTVTTGKDVDHITVNGTKVTSYTGSWFSSTRTWQVRVEAEEAGTMDVAVVCYNSDALASEPVVKTVEVTEQYTSITDVVKDIITGIFDRLWGRR